MICATGYFPVYFLKKASFPVYFPVSEPIPVFPVYSSIAGHPEVYRILYIMVIIKGHYGAIK